MQPAFSDTSGISPNQIYTRRINIWWKSSAAGSPFKNKINVASNIHWFKKRIISPFKFCEFTLINSGLILVIIIMDIVNHIAKVEDGGSQPLYFT